MTALNQTRTQKTVRKQQEKPNKEATSGEVQVPESWELSKEQKEFIDLFSGDEHIKQ